MNRFLNILQPKFGASLQILKVEIGGDDQSTDGTEASHMHEEWEENYNRGYEWWLMEEAKKRNPKIKLWGLSWTWPHWIGDEKVGPYKDLNKTAMYTVKWILGAKQYHNLTIDYVGIWNEKYCNFDYVLTLRKVLNDNKLQDVQVIACDDFWDGWSSLARNKTVMDAILAYGVHYPGASSPTDAIKSNKTLWSSEDYSTFNDEVGSGCWARILNQNYVNGYMTSTVAWALIASYYSGLPYEGTGLMTAEQPWSGYYEVKNPIWISAHTTQFTEIGWRYLQHGHGVGLLEKGGSYVSLSSPDSKQLTMVIETMSRNHSVCIRPGLPDYNITQQKATFKFAGSFADLKKLFLWRTQLKYDGTSSSAFQYNGSIEVSQSRISLTLDIDSIYTLTTVGDAKHGDFGDIPNSSAFPLPYEDDFQNYTVNEEPGNLSPQIGTWEIIKDSANAQIARQTVLTKPVAWSDGTTLPIALIGDAKWIDLNITARVRIPLINGTESVFVAAQVQTPGSGYVSSTGLFFWMNRKFSSFMVTNDLACTKILDIGLIGYQIEAKKWYTLSLVAKGTLFTASIDSINITSFSLPNDVAQKGFAAIGSGSFGYYDINYLGIRLP